MPKKKQKIAPKRKAVADTILSNPKLTGTEAALLVDPTLSTGGAANLASRALSDVKVLEYMEKHTVKAQEKIVNLMDSEKDDIQLRAAQDVLDRVHGKAIQRNENLNANITVVLSNYNAPIKNEDAED